MVHTVYIKKMKLENWEGCVIEGERNACTNNNVKKKRRFFFVLTKRGRTGPGMKRDFGRKQKKKK